MHADSHAHLYNPNLSTHTLTVTCMYTFTHEHTDARVMERGRQTKMRLGMDGGEENSRELSLWAEPRVAGWVPTTAHSWRSPGTEEDQDHLAEVVVVVEVQDRAFCHVLFGLVQLPQR